MLKMAFIGLGQAGGRIVDTFLSLDRQRYVGMAINTAENDLANLQNVPQGNRIVLNGLGSGRTPDIAKATLEEHALEVGEKSSALVEGADYVWLVAGLGGGTGTGCLDFMLDYIDDMFDDKPVGLIVTIPKEDDGAIQKINASPVLQKIHKAIIEQRICGVLPVDNNIFYRNLIDNNRSAADWRDVSNKQIANVIHELNKITVASGSSNFDRMDLLNLLNYSGCLAIGRAALRKTEQNAVVSTLRNALTEGYFSSGYRFEEAKSFATCFTLNKDGVNIRSASYESAVSHELRSISPKLLDSYFGYYDGQQNSVLTLAAGLGLPDRVYDMIEEVQNVRPAEIKELNVQTNVPDVKELHSLLRPKREEAKTEGKVNPFKTASASDKAGVSANNPFRRRG